MEYSKINILIIEDNPGDVRLFKEMLRDIPSVDFIVNSCARISQGLEYLAQQDCDVVLLDLTLPDSHGLETFSTIAGAFQNIPVLLLTGLDDENIAIDAMRQGAQDYLVKGKIDANLLAKSIRYAIQRKAIERKISNDKNQLEVTLSSIADGVITTDSQGTIILMNSAAQQITGWKQQDAIEKNIDDVFKIIDEQTNQPCESPVKAVLRTKKTFFLPINTILITKNGDEKYIEDDATPIKNENNKITGVVIVFRDAGEKRKSQNEVIKIQKLEALGVLAGGICHDFNNVLTAILNNVGYAKMKAQNNKELVEVLLDIEKVTLKSKTLTYQLLTFAKGGEPIKETTYIPELIKNIITFTLRGTNYTYQLTNDSQVWPVDLDIGQFSQAISNIIINAKEAMPDGGNIDIEVHNIAKDNPQVEIKIKDYGIGMPEKYLTKIFDPYFTTKKEGCGLGLAITYSIIKRHHGDISVNSKPGAGTTFTITLPMSQNNALISKEQTSNIICGKGKILIMDDEQMILTAMKKLLVTLGYDVKVSKDGQEAISLYEEAKNANEPFNAVIMDLMIPGGMGGKETIKKLLAIDKDVKAIVSSAYSQDPVMANPKEYGFKAVVAKPYEISLFSQILASVIENKP